MYVEIHSNVKIELKDDFDKKNYIGFTSAQSVPQIQENHYVQDKTVSSNTPNKSACLFTWIFKLASILLYVFYSLFIGEISFYVILIILCSVDFWVTKNITGR